MLILILSGVFVVHCILKSINHFSNMSDFYIIKSFVIFSLLSYNSTQGNHHLFICAVV